jgi:predicted TIM-barrel fold metal-dependent hydrolase
MICEKETKRIELKLIHISASFVFSSKRLHFINPVVEFAWEAIPFWLQRMDNRLREEKQSDLASATFYKNLQKNPSQYFKDHFYVTTSGMFWQPVLQFVCSVLGTDKVLFAVDYPYESNKEAVQFIESMPMSDSDKEKICHLNAEKLLRL